MVGYLDTAENQVDRKIALVYRDCDSAVIRIQAVYGYGNESFLTTADAEKAGYELLFR
jgi:hypothetical protein